MLLLNPVSPFYPVYNPGSDRAPPMFRVGLPFSANLTETISRGTHQDKPETIPQRHYQRLLFYIILPFAKLTILTVITCGVEEALGFIHTAE